MSASKSSIHGQVHSLDHAGETKYVPTLQLDRLMLMPRISLVDVDVAALRAEGLDIGHLFLRYGEAADKVAPRSQDLDILTGFHASSGDDFFGFAC